MTALHELTTEQLSRRIDAARFGLDDKTQAIQNVLLANADWLRDKAREITRYAEKMNSADDADTIANPSDYARFAADCMQWIAPNLSIIDVVRTAGERDSIQTQLQTLLDEQERRAALVPAEPRPTDADGRQLLIGDTIAGTVIDGPRVIDVMGEIVKFDGTGLVQIVELDTDAKHWVPLSEMRLYSA